jgi:hypothetical protein
VLQWKHGTHEKAQNTNVHHWDALDSFFLLKIPHIQLFFMILHKLAFEKEKTSSEQLQQSSILISPTPTGLQALLASYKHITAQAIGHK